nr:MAG: ORF1 [TTV-like mini virus]
MPYYWNPYYKRQRYRRRKRNRLFRWRARPPLRRKFYKRKQRKYRKKVKKRRFSKKKISLIVKQFQPKHIRKCKIVGYKCLIQGSPKRTNHNYIQYIYSKTPEHGPGGGGWSLIVFSLDSMFEDWQHLENIWTTSNAGLPLVRYMGCKFKFYQTENLDYCVSYDRCWPMLDTPYTHADSAPQRMLMKKHKFTIPSRKTQRNKKPYKKCFIKPPTQMTNKWYFQRDICKIPLVMLTTTGVSLTNPYCNPKAHSNCISIKCLSPTIFQNPAFQSYPQTSGYSPKTAQNMTDHREHNMYLWATTENITTHITKTNITQFHLVPLTNTKDYQAGTPILNDTWENKPKNWGNPFYHTYLDEQSYTVYISDMSPTNAKELLSKASDAQYSLTLPSTPLIYTVRYNPASDTGEGNETYLINNSSGTNWNPPENENLKIDGFPLYFLCWGWTDWVKKSQNTINPDENYIQVIKTNQFDIKLPYYIPIDMDFIEGYDPYVEHPHDGTAILPSTHSQQHWYLKLQFQEQSIEKICMSGPGCPRTDYYMQVYCKYYFYFKFGGCPKTLEKAYNPCQQPRWTTADNISGRLEITNPNTPPQTEIFSWDWQNDYVTEQCIERIKQYTEIDRPTFSITESKSSAKALSKIQKEDQAHQKKEEEDLINQLHQLQQQRLQLHQLLINKLTT